MKILKKPNRPNHETRRRPTETTPNVFSYYSRGTANGERHTRRTDSSGQQKSRGIQLRLGHLPSYLALGAILIALASSLYLQPSPRVVLTNTPGTVHRDAQTYQTAVENIWKQSVLNRTKVTVSTDKLSQKIRDQFGELASAYIQLPLLGRRATVVLTPATPLLELISNNGSYYIGSNGTVMAKIAEMSRNQLDATPVVRDESGLLAEPGKGILAPSEAAYLSSLSHYLAASNVKVSSITLPKNTARQVDVRLAGENYYVKFSFDTLPRQSVGTLLALLKKLQAENIKPNEYIDIRVEEKAFYK